MVATCGTTLHCTITKTEQSIKLRDGAHKRKQNSSACDHVIADLLTLSCLIIRIYHECEGGIEKYWHHEACQVMTNGDCKGQIFLSHPHTNNRFFSCSPLNTTFLYLKKKSF